MKSKNIYVIAAIASMAVPATAQIQSDSLFVHQTIEQGAANKTFTREQSTAAVSVISNKDVSSRSAKNIGNAILGYGNGLVSLQGSGSFYNDNPTFYVRGLQTLNSNNSPLILVDGIERDITMIDPEEVEEVQILKDAAATAIYGYKGVNGAILIKTKRGEYNSKTIRVKYEHVFTNMTNRPKFVDGPTYASAVNEALANEGQTARYSADELSAFRSGAYASLYPNVNWMNETFRHHGVDNRAAIEFSGGGEKFRYFTLGTILSNKGFIANPDMNDGYSTQDKYVRANIRTNLDIDLTPTTQFQTNILGSLAEMSAPGAYTNIWSLMYTVPSIAFPIKQDNGDWGGSSTWAGTDNPVAQSTGAAYYKLHDRSLYFDATIQQDLSAITPGLSATLSASYDTYSTLYEDHSKEYLYGYYPVSSWENGAPVAGDYWQGGAQGEMGDGAATSAYQRRLTAAFSVNYDGHFGDHDIYAQGKYDYDFEETTGVNTKIYRVNYSFMANYAYKNTLLLGATLVESGSSRLAPGTKWAFSPTFSAGAVIARNSDKPLNFLKVRGSWGLMNADYLPGGSWTYYIQSYTSSGTLYPYATFGAGDGMTSVNQMPVANPGNEKTQKWNLGLDATLLNAINVEFDYYNQHRYDIWIEGSGAYSKVIGFTAPYLNGGIVNSHGIELSVDATKSFGDFTVNLGGTFNYNKNKVVEQGEELKAYDNLVTTGNPLSSTYGLIAEGLFTSQAEIDAWPTQSFSTVSVGDIKYKDVNNDGVIDENDVCKIGYSTTAPEIYYTFQLGLDYKNVGFSAHFQGVGRYSAMLNTTGYYWGLISNTNISQYVYDNRWSPDNNDANAEFPRLSSTSNSNNYRNSTYWLRDRSFLKLRNVEVYYNLPKSLLQKTNFINGARLYARGTDLFCKDHIPTRDAEAYGAYAPTSRNIILGAQLTF